MNSIGRRGHWTPNVPDPYDLPDNLERLERRNQEHIDL